MLNHYPQLLCALFTLIIVLKPLKILHLVSHNHIYCLLSMDPAESCAACCFVRVAGTFPFSCAFVGGFVIVKERLPKHQQRLHSEHLQQWKTSIYRILHIVLIPLMFSHKTQLISQAGPVPVLWDLQICNVKKIEVVYKTIITGVCFTRKPYFSLAILQNVVNSVCKLPFLCICETYLQFLSEHFKIKMEGRWSSCLRAAICM